MLAAKVQPIHLPVNTNGILYKKTHNLLQYFVLFVTPIFFGSTFATAPSQAVTLASSQGEFKFSNINQTPIGFVSAVDSNTTATGNRSNVGVLATAQATFLAPSSEAFTKSLIEAFGEGRNYSGEGKSLATVIGNYVVDAGKSFSFDFTSDLNLQTSIDNPSKEKAAAFGDISFALFDAVNNSVLDFFSLTGNVNTPSGGDFIAFEGSDNLTLNNPYTTSNFGGFEESATASIQGSLQRYFADTTNVSLVEIKSNQVRVEKVPEPPKILSVLLCGGMIAFAKAKRKAMRKKTGNKVQY